MDSFTNKPTTKTPHINFNPSTGNWELSGKSVHEDSLQFYQTLFEWVNEYSQNPALKTTLDIQMDYFNTSTSKCLLDLFKKMEQISASGKNKAVINWHYNEMDDEMHEAGAEYASIIKVPFNLISFKK